MSMSQSVPGTDTADREIPPADRGSIEQLIATYSAGIDQKDRALFESVFTDDVQFSMGEYVGPFKSRDELTSFIMHYHAPLDASQHRVANVRIIDFSGDTARVRSAIDAILVKNGHDEGETFRVTGFYEDDVVRVDGEDSLRAEQARGVDRAALR